MIPQHLKKLNEVTNIPVGLKNKTEINNNNKHHKYDNNTDNHNNKQHQLIYAS